MTIQENKSKLNIPVHCIFLHHLFIYGNIDYDIEEGIIIKIEEETRNILTAKE